jgi:N6-adenosine-specific RNA methylase IME4
MGFRNCLEKNEQGVLNAKEYQVILADPPWRYNFSATKCRRIENKYPTMDLEAIKNIRITTDNNAVLFLWATAPKLLEALAVMDAWGFKYKTHCVWDKEIIGMGYWFRGQHELLLVGTKGKLPPPEAAKRIGSVIRSRRTKHSKKPDIIQALISGWYPNTKKIELFARQQYPGWICWGNEVGKFDPKIKDVKVIDSKNTVKSKNIKKDNQSSNDVSRVKLSSSTSKNKEHRATKRGRAL